MELKQLQGSKIENRVASLNRTFYGIETSVRHEQRKTHRVVLIVRLRPQARPGTHRGRTVSIP